MEIRSFFRGLFRVLVVSSLAVAAAPVAAQSFDQFHPDQYGRKTGMARYEDGYKEDAYQHFLRAARYADKTSQLALAVMHWNGDGAANDRAAAYAWADIAAERGYPDFVGVREKMWAEMSADEQQRAIDVGRTLYAEYGDDVAKPRLERLLKQGSKRRIGSRTGSATAGGGTIPMDSSARAAFLAAWQTTPGLQENMGAPVSKDAQWNLMMNVLGQALGAVTIHTANGYYGPENWEPKFYWRAQDSMWVPDGRVTAGELQKAKGRIRD